jgi:ankyrin repeat protein
MNLDNIIPNVMYLKRIFIFVNLTIVGTVFFSFGMKFFNSDYEPKVVLSTISDPNMRASYEQQYTQELFDRVKQNQMNWNITKDLLQSGIDINTQDEAGRTPLFYAVLNKNMDYINFFLHNGADTTLKDKHNMRAIDYLDKKKDFHLYWLFPHDNLQEQAEQQGYKNITISRKIDAEGNVISSQVTGQIEETWTPLMKAIKDFNNDIVAQLIQSGQYRGAKTNNGSTAIFFAINFKNNRALDLLLESNVELDFCNNLKVNPLRFAVIKNNEYAVKEIVKHGANIYEKCGNPRTPRELAEIENKDSIERYLSRQE